MDILSELKAQINFVELAAMHGYELNKRKSTKKTLFLEKGEDKILVYPNTGKNEDHRYSTCNNTNDGGTIIDFLINKGIVSSVNQAIPYLKNLDPASLRISDPVVMKKVDHKPFVPVPTFPLDCDNYLVRCRAIPLDVLRGPFFGGSVMSGSRLNSNKTKNAIFPLVYDNRVVGQNIRNLKRTEWINELGEVIVTFEEFKHLVEGSNKTNGVWKSSVVAGAPVAVFENPIDAISFHVLKGKAYNFRATIGSPSRDVVKSIAQEALHTNSGFVLCGDNDKSGKHFNLNFLTNYISFREGLDLITSFDKKSNSYSLILKGHNTAKQRIVFDGIAKSLGIETVKLSFTVDQIHLQTRYEAPVLGRMAKALVNLFGLNSVAIEVSQTKDFNQDLQLREQEKVLKKKVTKGLSL